MSPTTLPRPRVVTFVTGLGRAGAETALLGLLDATRAEFDHRVISLISGGALAPEFRARGIPLIELGLKSWFVPPRAVLQISRYIEEARADIVTGHMYHGILAATFAGRLMRPMLPLIWVVQHSAGNLHCEGWSTRLALRLCRSLSRVPTAVVYASTRVAEEHAAQRFRPAKSVVIRNGVDLQRFRFDREARRRLRAQWRFSDDHIVMGHVARVHPVKDHATMITALKLAMAREPRLCAVFCGLGTDRLPIPDDLRPRVRLLGLRSDVPQVMSACDIGCVSSSADAGPYTLAEFMACERPCVTTDVGFAAEIVRTPGQIVPPRNATALAEALLAMSRMSETAHAARAEAGRKCVVEQLDIRSAAARHAALWWDVIHRGTVDPGKRQGEPRYHSRLVDGPATTASGS